MNFERERYERLRLSTLAISIFRKDGAELMKFNCKHDADFVLAVDKSTDLNCFICSHGCEFHLPFNPSKFPEGISYKYPSSKSEKVLPTLSTGGKY